MTNKICKDPVTHLWITIYGIILLRIFKKKGEKEREREREREREIKGTIKY